MRSLKRITHVEDDHDILEIAGLCLTAIGGFEVAQYCQGRLAVADAEECGADLFLLDVMMPEIDGVETLRLLREFEQHKDTPAIFMTAKNLNDGLETHHLGEHVIGVIDKPFDTMQLTKEIQKLWAEHLS